MTGHAPNKAARLVQVLTGKYLHWKLATVATLLVSPSLFIGFHLDDLTHRHLFSSLPGAAFLREAYESPFGIANGQPETTRQQIEHGMAPWWTPGDLLISLWRPVSEATHALDAALWPDNAFLMHLQNLAWYFALVVLATQLYRAFWGATTLAGVAAMFYAFDHAHGFAVGWIANRNAVIATTFAVASLLAYRRSLSGSLGLRGLSLLSLALSLLSGEGAVAIVGYVCAHALFVEQDAWLRRMARVAPYLALVVAWRVLYTGIGRGAHGSGLYIDPGREPLTFLHAVLERAPVLLLGTYSLPPAEAYVFAPKGLQPVMLALAVALLVAVVLWSRRLLRQDPVARFWAAGFAGALVPACSTHPHNRLLFFAGLGAFGLLSQMWHAHLERPAWLPGVGLGASLSRAFTAALAGFHLIVSPLLLPLMACSVAYTAAVGRGLDELVQGPPLAGKTLVFLHASDYYQTKLVHSAFALAHVPGPLRAYGLSYGAGPVLAERTGAHTLELTWPNGLWDQEIDGLYRDPRDRMAVGDTVSLTDLTVRVLEVTPDGRPRRARFDFAMDLDAPALHWVRWDRSEPQVFRWRDTGPSIHIDRSESPLGW